MLKYRHLQGPLLLVALFVRFTSAEDSLLSIDDAVGDWPKEVYDQIYETYVCPPSTYGAYPLEWNEEETLTPLHFVNQLRIPPVAKPKTSGSNGSYYEIAVRKVMQEILPGVQTEILAYGSLHNDDDDETPLDFATPGPTILQRYNETIEVRWINEIEGPHPLSKYIDTAVHWANPNCQNNPCNFGNTDGSYDYTGPVPIITHLHGGTSTQESDGHPLAWYLLKDGVPEDAHRHGLFYQQFRETSPNGDQWTEDSMIAEYNETEPKVLWYHDHTLGITRLNVASGLSGFFQVYGGPNDMPNLPDGDHQIPLVFQDKIFNQDGSQAFTNHSKQPGFNIPFCGQPTCNAAGLSDVPATWMPAFFGDVATVNGKAWPNLDVAASCYRFNILIASMFQTYRLQLKFANGTSYPFTVVGTDQGWTRKSSQLESMELSPSERVTILVDFSKLQEGEQLYVVNALPCVGTPAATAPENNKMPLSKMFYQMRFTIKTAMAPSSPRGCLSTTELDPLLDSKTFEKFQSLMKATPITTRDVSFHVMNSASVITNRSGGTTSGGNIVTIDEACGVDISEYASTELVTQKPAKISPQLAVLYLLGELGSPKRYVEPMTIYPFPNRSEWWKFTNPSPNAHPMHVHEGGFLIANRSFALPNLNSTVGGLPARAWENGPKDVVMVYMYSNATTKNVFFRPGLFMYHCHILTHEDHDMMRPFCVKDPDGELPDSCKLHGRDHCSYELPNTTNEADEAENDENSGSSKALALRLLPACLFSMVIGMVLLHNMVICTAWL